MREQPDLTGTEHLPEDGRIRVVIAAVSPQVDDGRYPIKRVAGEDVVVEADIFADGHDQISAVVRHRALAGENWSEAFMEPLGNDRWRARFAVRQLGQYVYTVEAWIDPFKTWRRDLEKKVEAGQDVSVDLLTGAQLLRSAAAAVTNRDHRAWLEAQASDLQETSADVADRVALARDPRLAEFMQRHGPREFAARFDRELRVEVDPVLARCGAWYELFPRSVNSDGRRHGTLRDVRAILPRVAAMGFDVLYLPPIHPIGSAFRKGPNNAPSAGPDDPGSPWGIGAAEGGHKAIHPALGTIDDFRALVEEARALGLHVALDVALQCSPDHPYVREHPEWFKRRGDGSIQYAENPPKKYQDIYPLDFETADWRALWQELRSIVEYWVEQGVTVFRVDNPHTKAFRFWGWLIATMKQRRPELIFLSEAFTRPKPMYQLAKLGFTQSYNYFPWRNTAEELRHFMTELTRSPVREFFRPNLWPNTPDILPQFLQLDGRAAFIIRFILAATLGASYGIYGPAFELGVKEPRAPGEEEYLHSEKYEIKAWNLDDPDSLEPLITRVNHIRRENAALQSNERLAFHGADNDQLLVYSKRTAATDNVILTVVNLDPHHTQRGFTELDLVELGIDARDTFQVHDLLTGARYLWRGARNLVEFDPKQAPAAIFRVRPRVRTEADFDYFL